MGEIIDRIQRIIAVRKWKNSKDTDIKLHFVCEFLFSLLGFLGAYSFFYSEIISMVIGIVFWIVEQKYRVMYRFIKYQLSEVQ